MFKDAILKLRPLNRSQRALNVEKSFEYDEKTLTAFLDLEGARFGSDRTIIRWIMAVLSNRIVN